MKVNIKNQNLYEMLTFCQELHEKAKDPESMQKELEKLSIEERGVYIIESFLMDLLTAADENDVWLDLTYQSLKNLGPALSCLYVSRVRHSTPEENQAGLEKSLAAYLTFLCVNENGGSIGTRFARDPWDPDDQHWAGVFSVYPGDDDTCDFLPAAREALEVSEGLLIRSEPLVIQYLKAADMDLTDFGLDDYRVILE